MRFESIRLTNFQSFSDSGVVPLRNITVFVGKNNAGKSAFLNAMRTIQVGASPGAGILVRSGYGTANIRLEASDIPEGQRAGDGTQTTGAYELVIGINGAVTIQLLHPGSSSATARNPFQNTMREAVILPLPADRAGRSFQEQINAQLANSVSYDTVNLPALVSRLVGARGVRGQRFTKACQALLGFEIVLIPSTNGQLPGLRTEKGEIPLSAMGTGVLSLVRMLVYLCEGQRQIILIEEPENDLTSCCREADSTFGGCPATRMSKAIQ